jgi:hypothetical protein
MAQTGVLALRRTFAWIFVLTLIVLVCFFDSSYVAVKFDLGQWISNALMILAFAWIYRGAPPRLRALMKDGVFIATAGEVLFSLGFGMYEYRLQNLPLYVPPGHSLLYAAVYYFVREPFVVRSRRAIAVAMLALSLLYAAYWLLAYQDLYGALCTALAVVLIARDPHSRLFFLTMFLFVGFLEQVGSRFDCWYWHPVAFDRFAWLPSGNPPSGISVFYFGFDVVCLLAYLRRRPDLKARYKRLKQEREARAGGWPARTRADLRPGKRSRKSGRQRWEAGPLGESFPSAVCGGSDAGEVDRRRFRSVGGFRRPG